MINANRYIIFLAGILLLMVIGKKGFSQNDMLLKGLVVSGDGNPLAGASVTLKTEEKQMIRAFCISSTDGSFLIRAVNLAREKYILQVSHIGYQSIQKNIVLPGIAVAREDTIIMLLPAGNALKEIIVKATIPFVQVRKDTIEFSAAAFQSPEVNKVEDLLKNINGFAVDGTGRITYHGKELEKILIEGEDLADKNYKALSKNLNASFIDKVQVLQHYHDNRLLANVEQSDKIGINLKLGGKFKNRPTGNIEAGGACGKRYIADESIVGILPAVKTLFFSNYNNTGMSSEGNFNYYRNNADGFRGDRYEKDADGEPVKSGKLSHPAIDNRYIKDNDDFSNSLLSSRKIGKAVKMRSVAGYSKVSLRNSDFVNSQVIVPSGFNWTMATAENSVADTRGLIFETALTHDRSKENTGTYTFSLSLSHDHDQYNNIVNGAVVDTLSEWLKNKRFNYHFAGNETFKLKNGKVFLVDVQFSGAYTSQSFNTLTYRLAGYFKMDSLFSNYLQRSREILHNAGVIVKWMAKQRRIYYEYGASATSSGKSSVYDLDIKTRELMDTSIDAAGSLLKYKEKRFLVFGQIQTRALKKCMVSAGLSAGFGTIGINQFGGSQSQRSVLAKSFLECRYFLSDFKSITARGEFGFSQPGADFFYGKGILSGNATILDGASVLRMPTKKLLSLSYSGNDIYSNSQVFINAVMTGASAAYNNGYYLEPAFTKNIISPLDHNYQLLLHVNAEKFFPKLSSKIIVALQGLQMRTVMPVNEALHEARSGYMRMQVKYITAFLFRVNGEAAAAATYFKNTLFSDVSYPVSNNQWQYELNGKLKISVSKKIYANLVCDVYWLSVSKSFISAGAYLNYRMSTRLGFSMTGHNLLNQKIIMRRDISSTNISENTFNLVGRYVLGQLSLSF